MNILFVAQYYLANPDFVRLSKELASRKHSMSVATSFRPVDEKVIDSGVRVFEIKPLISIYRIPHTLSLPLPKLQQIFRQQEINVIHILNDGSTNAVGATLIANVLNRPLVYTIQGTGTRTGNILVDSVTSLYTWTVERWVANQAQRVLLLSRSLASTADKMGIDRSKVVVIPSGVDAEYFSRERLDIKDKATQLKDELDLGDGTIVGYVGRLFPAKGLTYLFSAAKRIQRHHPNITLLIVGDGAQRNELEAMASDLKVKTLFAGWQRDVRPYYALMDIFVLPSLFEGLPNVILEAMAMETAVVATNVGGNPDVLANGENGYLVPARNVQQLAQALETLVGDCDLRAKMGTVNRQKVLENFQWDQIAHRVEKVYREIA